MPFRTIRSLSSSRGRLLVNALLAAGLFAALPACSSSPSSGLDTATASIEETGRQIDVGVAEMDGLMRTLSLMDVDEDAETDLKSLFGEYRDGIVGLEKAASSVRSRRAAMMTRTQEHIEAWRGQVEEINSESAREVSATRQQAFEASVKEVEQSLDGLADAYSGLLSDLRDIEIVLANDLSQAGVQAARPLIREAIEQAATVRIRAGDTSRTLLEARNEFSR